MKNIIVAFFALIIIGFGVIGYYFYQSMNITAMKYSNADFSINIPDGAQMLNNKEDISTSGYIPVCDPDTSILCLAFPGSTYPNSNFNGAAVSVNVIPAITVESTCLTMPQSGRDAGTTIVTINGTEYASATGGDAAMSHQSYGTNYRTFHDNKCYELTSLIYTTTFEVYEPGTIEEFTTEQESVITAKLNSIIQSFKFNN